MSDELHRQLADALADGKITDGDAEAVLEFADFLHHAGPPTVKGKPSPDGLSPIQRLIAVGRNDLIAHALGELNGESAFWGSLTPEQALLNTAGDPPYEVASVGTKIWLSLGEPKLDARLLDLGCGQGRLTNTIAAFLRNTDAVVHGVDISRALLDVAVIDAQQQNLRNVHYWHNDGRRLPNGLGGRKYDLVYSVAMFQHIPHEAMWGYIRQVEPRLNRGGVFTFTIAVGEIDEFLNHQIADPSQFANDLLEVFDSAAGVEIDGPDERGWTWVTVTKED